MEKIKDLMIDKMNAEKGMTAEELLIENLIEKVCVYLHDKESGICAKAIRINLPTLINQFKKDVCRKQRDIMRAIVSANRYKSYLEMKQALTNAPEPK